ncbi:MAG: nucleotidyl transferase AbiEii/AbiGii toxin family protein [Bacteroidota bacterium]
MLDRHLELLQTVAKGFGDLNQKITFVGGAVLNLYITDEAAPEFRPSGDIDCLLNLPALLDHFQWEKMLIERGFVKHPGVEGPTCRWTYEGIPLTISPIQGQVELLGYRNIWYEEGLFHSLIYSLPNGNTIRIFHPAYYTAAKVNAFLDRGQENVRHSEDFQDLVFLVENRPELSEDVAKAFHEVRSYVRSHFRRFLAYPDLEEGLYYALPIGADYEHVQKIVKLMRKVAAMELTFV